MIRRLMGLAFLALLLGGCSALPAEERSFAVALGISEEAGTWEVSARLPSYQTGGGYLTLSARGASLEEALTMLDAAAPMRMHYGQVRLLIFGEGVAESEKFYGVLEQLARRPDLRLQAQVCVTRDPPGEVLDVLEPQTGTRLSKSLDVLLETRRRLGIIPQAELSGILRMGQRQSPVLLAAALEQTESLREGGMDASAGRQAIQGGGKVQLAGGWLMNANGRVQGEVSPEEMQLLSLLQNRLRRTTLMLEGSAVTLSDAACRVTLDGNRVLCRIKLQYTASALSEEGMMEAVHRSVQALTARLASCGCDALGLGGWAVRHAQTLQAWRQMDWRTLYQALEWTVEADVCPPAGTGT